MATIKEKIAQKMGKAYSKTFKGINAFVSKHPKFNHSRILSHLDSWSFNHSPEGKKMLGLK